MSKGGLIDATDLQRGEVLSMPQYEHYALAQEPWTGVSDHLIIDGTLGRTPIENVNIEQVSFYLNIRLIATYFNITHFNNSTIHSSINNLSSGTY